MRVSNPALIKNTTVHRRVISQSYQQFQRHSRARVQLQQARSYHPQHSRALHNTTAQQSSMTSPILHALVSSPENISAAPSDIKDKAHHNKNGKGFINPWPSYKEWSAPQIVSKIIWMRLTGKWQNPDTTPPTVPVQKPKFLETRETPKLRTTWLGHACYYVEFPSGLRVLFDPVFEERCSPFSFMGPKRYTAQPCPISDLPYIDAVCISHSHYDHLSYPTVLEIQKRFPNAQFFAPLGNKTWFDGIGVKNMTEMDWWEERTLTLSASDSKESAENVANTSSEVNGKNITATIGCLPCQHTSGRTPFNRAVTLWSSWSVNSGGKKLYFAGDTGYRTVPDTEKDAPSTNSTEGYEAVTKLPHCPAFKQIGDLRGPFDVGLIPIGAYDPRWIMSPMHANPFDSVNIFKDTKCQKALGMHWGTWVLTTEEVLEPPSLLKTALKWAGVERGEERFGVCDIGESREFD